MASGFRQTLSGKLEYRFTYQGRQYCVRGNNQKECKANKEKLVSELSSGLKKEAKSITFGEYSQEWLKAKNVTAKKSSVFSYQKKLKMVSSLDSKKMQKIDRRDILALQSYLASNYSTSTTNWLISMVRQIFNCAIADDIVVKNPVFQIKPLKRIEPKATATIHRALTREEQTAFFDAAKEHNSWYLELFEFMISTGVRVGEAGALTWKDIDTSIHINKTVARTGGSEYGVQSTKTEAGCRDLPITPSVKNTLAKQKRRIAEYNGVEYCKPNKLVFPAFSDGEHIDASMIDNAITYVCGKAKIDRFTSHAFRDTYATRCIQQGMQPNTLKKLMGHTKISITMDLYAQVMPEDMEVAMSKISIL